MEVHDRVNRVNSGGLKGEGSSGLGDGGNGPALPLPSRLPPDLHLAISRLGIEDLTSQTSSSSSMDSLSLTTQLSHFFPSVQDIAQIGMERRQALLRQDLAVQERYIEKLHSELASNIQATGEAREVRASINFGNPIPSNSRDAENKIEALLQLLASIREKASMSEEVVREITRDIRKLDTCKRNVVTSMTALKRLQMLVNAVAQLERLTKANRFREASSAFSAVKSLQSSFKGFSGVERVASIQRDVTRLQQELLEKSKTDFETYFTQESDRSLSATSVPDAVLVIDAIGGDAVTTTIDFYCTIQLKEYRRIFRATDEAGQLDNVARRFAWFRRILKQYDDDHSKVFEEGPIKKWNVSKELIRKFTEITREDLRSVLIRTQGKLQVSILLESLNSSLEYEKAMSKRLGMPFVDVCAAPTTDSISTASAKAAKSSSLTLSSAFDPYLGLFVEAQDRTLSDMMQNFKRQGLSPDHSSSVDTDTPASRDHHHTVAPASTELFYFYRQVLEQCARLSTREPFRDLCMIYKKHLHAFAEEVLKTGLLRADAALRRSQDTRSNTTDLQRYGLIVNTADYCATTSKQLEGKLKEKIDPDFVDQVDLGAERDVFLAIVSFGISYLAKEVETSTEAAFNLMLRPPVPWSSIESTSTKSSYVDDFAAALEHVAVVVRQDLENKRYVRNWCDKVVGFVLARFMYNIVRLKPVSAEAAKQLITDVGEIRISLLELPRYSLSEEGSTSAAASYNRYVSRGITRIETLLKTVMSPAEPAEELIATYMRLIGDRSFSNFQKILDLKGVRKVEQNTIMDSFVASTAQETDLQESSFLTTLDMDTSQVPTQAAAATYQSAFMSFGTQDIPGTPPATSVSRFPSLALNTTADRNRVTSPTTGEATAQRAFSDLRRFGSMLVGRREH